MDDPVRCLAELTRAFESDEPRARLRALFERSAAERPDSQARDGSSALERLLAEAQAYAERLELEDALEHELIELATDPSTDREHRQRVLGLLDEAPGWRRLFDDLSGAIGSPESVAPVIEIHRDGHELARCELPPEGDEAVVVRGAGPGHYELRLEGGRLLFEGELGEADLLWRAAHPGTPLPLAADSEAAAHPAPPAPTRREALDVAPDGAGNVAGKVAGWELRVFAGLESGRLEIGRRKPREHRDGT